MGKDKPQIPNTAGPDVISDPGDEGEVAPTLSGQSLDLLKAGQDVIPRMPLPAGETGDKTTQPFTQVPATILPERVPFDPAKRTVLVLDDYKIENQILMSPEKPEYGFSHGELSARMAEGNGYNVVRMQLGLYKPAFHDIPSALRDIDNGMADGTLNLKPGDVVNISQGVDVTFKEAQRLLGVAVTPENLASKRDEILQAAHDRVDDKSLSARDRAVLRHIVAINDGIKKLQERGLNVVTAAGNDGVDMFNIGLLACDRMYSALTRDGQPAHYSARNSLTQDGRGDIDFNYYPVNGFDPTPLEQQTGKYRLDGTNVYLDSADFGGDLEPVTIAPTANPLRFPNVQVEMTPANLDSWTKGVNIMGTQGTSFVNVFRLVQDYPPERDKK